MAYSQNFPAQRPVFTLDASNAGRLDPRCSFTRASTGTFFGTDKVLSSENLLLQSSSLDTSPWSASGSSINPTSVTGPDGATSDGWTLTENGATTNHSVSQTFSANAPSDSYALTFYGKRGTGTRYASVVAYTTTNNYEIATFDLAGGAVTTYSGSSSTYTGVSATQTASGNGYYKCVFKFTGQVSGGAVYMSDVASPTSWGNYAVYQYAGDSSSSIVLSRFSLASTGATDYNATTTQIARSYQTKLQTAASGAARFEHSATDGQSMGILVEGQSTNLLAESTDFSGSWQILNASKSLEAIAPNGALNAIAFREGTNSSEKRLLRYYTGGGGSVTISIYAKLLGNTRRLVIREANASAQYATFDLATGTVVSGFGSIESVGNGWFRCQLNLSTTGTTQAAGFYTVPADGNYGDREYAGDGYSGLLLAHPQAEDQSFASSWISTTSSTATRASDQLSVATADIGYTGGPVSVVGEASFLSSSYSSSPQLFDLNDNTSSNKFAIYRSSGANGLFSSLTASGTFYGTTTALGTAVANTDYKFAATLSSSRQASCVNGGTVGEDTSVVLPTVTTLDIGNDYNGGAELDGHIKRIAIYGEALSDTNLQALTS